MPPYSPISTIYPAACARLHSKCGELVLLRAELRGRERTAILIPIQIFVYALTAGYLIYVATELHHRNERSWQAIVSRLSADPCETDRPLPLCRNSGLMMQMADYVERNAQGFERTSLDEFRSNGLALRLMALRNLIKLS